MVLYFSLRAFDQLRHQPPHHEDNFALAGLGIEPDNGLEALRRGVVRRGKLGVIENIGVMRAKPISDPLLDLLRGGFRWAR